MHDLAVDVGEAEAAFLAFFFAAGGVREHGVDVDAIVLRLAGVVDDEKPDILPHLRSGQADAFVGAHQLEHFGDQRLEPVVKNGHRFTYFSQLWIGVIDNLEVFNHRPYLAYNPRVNSSTNSR